MLTARYVVASVVVARKELKERYFEDLAIREACARDKKKQDAVLHSSSCLVIRE